MRRLFVAAAVGAAFLLLAAPAFAGLKLQAGQGRIAPAPHVPHRSVPSLRYFAPLGARLSLATASVSGTVYDSYHSTLGNVHMAWWSKTTSGDWTHGLMTTLGDGSYTASPAATGDGEIYALPDNDTALGRLGQTWTAGDSYPGVDIYPGTVDVSANRDGVWNAFGSLTLTMWGDTAYSYSYRETSDTSSNPATVSAPVLDGKYDKGAVNFWPDEGVEFTPALTVSSGASSSGIITVAEAGAQRVQFPRNTFKWSGKPGATISVDRYNFPAGWRNAVSGYSDPSTTAIRDYGNTTSRGGAKESVSVKVPSTAKPGYAYWIGFQHIDASGDALPLYVETAYQVCTIKPSKSSVTKRTPFRITGVVPTENHWGSQLGLHKKVYLLWHKGTAPLPTTQKALKTWFQVGKKPLTCTGTGAYTSPYYRMAITGTFLVYYEGDQWYQPGFTSTAKVTVR